ncbi:MAG: transcriptional repressor [Ruminococcaceae bacterium]|nr:transcriptional repressor [Oscillospiraceae bacterium]
MKTYDTEQRRTLIKILEKNTDKQFSAFDLIDLCEEEYPNIKINTSTVYRLLLRLVKEGKAERSASSDGRQFLYRYIANCECSEHIHLKCKKCGQILHLEDDEAEKNLVAAMEKFHFKVDEAQSLIVGVCEKCGE